MLKRIKENPFLIPDAAHSWEAYGAFNPCIVKANKKIHLLYRAMAAPAMVNGVRLSVSSIAYGCSNDGIHFKQNKLLIQPEHYWEIFGCEDPRITKLGNKYYIFYTALSDYPFNANGIKIGLAITKDFETILAKHAITTFNSKAMALFPEKINGKFVAILTVHTDIPPAKIALAFFNKEKHIWSEQYWNEWYASLDHHVLPLLRSTEDHLEVGAPPIKTKEGWLLVYSYIQSYFGDQKVFGIEVVLLDLKNPLKIIAKLSRPLMIPEAHYELIGNIPNVIFPSGALLEKDKLIVYYGAADTACCAAVLNLSELLQELSTKKKSLFISGRLKNGFKRYSQNPIIVPRPEFSWEAKATFNPAAIYADGKVHIIYRALSKDDTSVFGYASSIDGVHITERCVEPIYVPRENFEKKLQPGNSGCEDPRITKMGNRFYVFYTAYDGFVPRVAFTSILVDDFLNQWWNWDRAKVISSNGIHDKNACLLPKKINNQYVIFHRVNNNIFIDYVDNFSFIDQQWLINKVCVVDHRRDQLDISIQKVGISAPPIETKYGWLMFYHWVSAEKGVQHYSVGAALLDLSNPAIILKRGVLLLEPEMNYEITGIIANVVFPCGAVLLHNEVLLYYGGADRVVAVAKMDLEQILTRLGV